VRQKTGRRRDTEEEKRVQRGSSVQKRCAVQRGGSEVQDRAETAQFSLSFMCVIICHFPEHHFADLFFIDAMPHFPGRHLRVLSVF